VVQWKRVGDGSARRSKEDHVNQQLADQIAVVDERIYEEFGFDAQGEEVEEEVVNEILIGTLVEMGIFKNNAEARIAVEEYQNQVA
jgi:hypothetical protein